jgi:hypothetical protein
VGEGRVSIGDIEAKLRQIDDQLQQRYDGAKPALLKARAAGAAAAVLVAYLVGRRRGRLRSTVVEVRRV